MAETNPVEQRMEYLADSWNDIPKKAHKIIRAIIEPGDERMIEAFYSYMLGLGTPIIDIAINFDVPFIDYESFSENLIGYLDGMVDLWNQADFSATEVDKVNIDWQADYNLTSKKNKAALFVLNVNKLTEILNLEQGRFVIANLRLPYIGENKALNKWIKDYLESDIHPQLKLLVTDIKGSGLFDKTSLANHNLYHWQPEIDTANVISKVAAMGDPQDPATIFRQSFAKMMKAFGENNRKTVKQEATNCIEIACRYIEKDPNWIAQVVTVNIILSNDYFKNKEFDNALRFADQAIKVGETVPQILGAIMGCGVLAQAQMNKATMLVSRKEWRESMELYETAAINLTASNIHISAIDSYRMAAYCAAKTGAKDRCLKNLIEGYKTGSYLDNKTLRNTTFSLVLVHLLKMKYESFISYEELNARAQVIYGEDWENTIKAKWSDIDLDNLYEENQYATTQLEMQKQAQTQTL